MNNKDNCGRVKAQLMNGNSLSDTQVYQSNIIYSITDFIQEEITDSLESVCFGSGKIITKNTHSDLDANMKNEQAVIDDLYADTKTFIAKYSRVFHIITESELHYNDQGYCLLDDDYLKLFDRIRWYNKKPKIIRFKDGEKRRRELYIDGCIIRKIKSDICFGELLYNLVVRREHYYDNSDGVLTNKLLV